MLRSKKMMGFTLIEVLLVLAIIGIISAIAIPSYLGQRRRARVIGDAISNARVIHMLMEQRKADNGSYGVAGSAVTWTYSPVIATYNVPALAVYLVNPCPGFLPGGNSRMNYAVRVTGPLAYTLNVFDPSVTATPLVYQTDQNGAELFRLF